jgi:copper chaperone CopZ
MSEKTYIVVGMTCAHCVLSREEVSELAGVAAVAVDLESGHLRVQGEQIRDAAVRAAVAEVAYEVAT